MNRRAVFNGKDASLGWMPWSRIAFPKRCAFSEFFGLCAVFLWVKTRARVDGSPWIPYGCSIFWHFWPWDSSPLVECLELFSKTFQTRLKTLTHQWWKNMTPVWVLTTRVTSRIMSDIFPINWRRISGTAPDFHEMLLLLPTTRGFQARTFLSNRSYPSST